MDDVVFSHVVQRYQNLDSKPLYQRQRKALERVHFDKLVKVDREQFKRDDQVLSEHKLVKQLNDVLLVFRVILVQSFDQFDLNQTLLVKSLFVLEDLQGNKLLVFVVVYSQHNTK